MDNQHEQLAFRRMVQWWNAASREERKELLRLGTAGGLNDIPMPADTDDCDWDDVERRFRGQGVGLARAITNHCRDIGLAPSQVVTVANWWLHENKTAGPGILYQFFRQMNARQAMVTLEIAERKTAAAR